MLPLLTLGCGIFQTGDYAHEKSCGPKALCRLGAVNGIEYSKEDISNNITSNFSGNFSRNLLSVVRRDAIYITWPTEMKAELTRLGYSISTISGTDSELKEICDRMRAEGKTGIVLLNAEGDITSYHWMLTNDPKTRPPTEYYLSRTTLHVIYKVELIDAVIAVDQN